MIKVNDLIGVKFVGHGRSVTEGFDCYGLAIEVCRRFGHKLDDLWYDQPGPATFAKNAEQKLASMSYKLSETDRQDEGNIILFSDDKGRMVHIGVFLKEGVFIHADTGGVMVTKLDDYYRKNWKVYEWLQ